MYIGTQAFQNFLGRCLKRPTQGLQNPLDTLARLAAGGAVIHWLVCDDPTTAVYFGRIALFFGGLILSIAFGTRTLLWGNGPECFKVKIDENGLVSWAKRTRWCIFSAHRLAKEGQVLLELRSNEPFRLVIQRERYDGEHGWHRDRWERLEVSFCLKTRSRSNRLSDQEAIEVADWLLSAFLEFQRDTVWREVTDVRFMQHRPKCVDVVEPAILQRWPDPRRYHTQA